MNSSPTFEDRERDLFVHIHVPKTAGSMLNWILSKNLGSDFGKDGTLLSYRKYNQDDMRQLFFLYAHRCFAAHVYSLSGLPLDTHPHIHAFAFVREPVEKTVSVYSYLRQRPITSPTHPTRLIGLSELVKWVQSEKCYHPFMLDCSQVAWITGLGMGSIDAVSEYMSRGIFHCFPTNRFDEACVLLESLFPTVFKDCSYAKRINVSSRVPVDDATRDVIRSLPWMREDTELVSIANRHLDELIIKHFAGPAAFQAACEDFRSRCEALRVKGQVPPQPQPVAKRCCLDRVRRFLGG